MSAQEADCCSPRVIYSSPGFLVLFGLIAAIFLVAPLFPRHTYFALSGVAFVAGAAWCGFNFWRSRHAHCLVTTIGWSALAALTFVETAQGRSLIAGDEQLVFLGVLGVGLVFEAAWVRAFGTSAVRLRRPLAR